MTQYNNRFRAVVLAALMVLSVFAGAVAFTGTAAADQPDNRADTDLSAGTAVFLGEDLTGFTVNNSTESTPLGDLIHTQTGEVLQEEIPTTATVGRYSSNGETTDDAFVNVRAPRVTDFDVNNLNSASVNGGTLQYADSGTIGTVEGSFDFNASENISITVTDADGLDVTNEVIDDTADQGESDGSFSFDIVGGIDTGTYTVTVEGTDDLDFGEATQSTTVTVIDQDEVSVSLANEEVVQGNNVQFTVTNGVEDDYHAVVIASGEFSSDWDATSKEIFRNVGDTVQAGFLNNSESTAGSIATSTVGDVTHAYAIVQIDGGQAVGSIDTTYLDTDTITVDVFDASQDQDTAYWDNANTEFDTNLSGVSEDTDVDLVVTDGAVTLDAPTGQYVIGSQVTISGSVSPGVSNVALYARGGGDWERVNVGESNEEISVDADDTFELEDVQLSDTTSSLGNGLLSQPGSYRLAVVDATDFDAGTTNTFTTTQFNDETADTVSIVSVTEDVSATFATYNGQLSNDDEVLTIEGTSLVDSGADILLVLVDSRGDVYSETHTVDADDGEIDVDVDFSGASLSDGSVSAHVISMGRDGVYGDGDGSEDDAASLKTYVDGLTGTADQVRERILAATVDETGSDDVMVSASFRLANSLTTITELPAEVAVDGTVTVTGQTNRNPESPSDNEITIEIFDADGSSEAITTTDTWGADGVWSVSFDLADLPTGTYTVEATDGTATDREDFAVVESVSTPAPEPEPEPEPEPAPEPEPTEEPAEEETPAETPGFGLLVALTALVAAGFLALRRLD